MPTTPLHHFRKQIVLILLLLTSLISVSTIYAVDEVVGSGTPGSCTQQALRQAVTSLNNAKGGTITFNCGVDPHTIALTQQLKFINTNQNTSTKVTFVIDGGGLITLDGQNETRVLYTSSNVNIDFTVRNISIINGNAAFDANGERAANQGGGIYSGYRNKLTVENAHFQNNKAKGDRHPYHGGGAIAIDTTSIVKISDSTFINNRSPNGGAINNLLSKLTITRSEFRNNKATRADPGGGGAIYNDGGRLTITNTHIINNDSANLGGGIFSWANISIPEIKEYLGKTVIRNTVIANNDAEHGGGLWKGGSSILELVNSSVTGNTAKNRGAGISGTGPGPNFKIINSTIAFNRVKQTGSAAGIFSANNRSTVKNSTIAYNTVPDDASSVGAAIHGDVTLTNTIIAYNTGGWNGVWSCMGSIGNGGHNLQFPSNTCGNIPVKNAKLSDTLLPALNEVDFGETQTLALLSGSPAINKAAKCPAKDQRGVVRPQGDACDIGAWELEGIAPAVPVITAPTNGHIYTGVDATPTFTWESSAGATRYKLILKDAKNKTVIQKTQPVASFGCDPTCAFDLSTTTKKLTNQAYKLSIEALNDLGKRKTTVSFSAQFPGKATAISPIPDAVVSQTPTFQWEVVPTAEEYRIVVEHIASGNVRTTAWVDAATACPDVCEITLTASEKLRNGKNRWRIEARNAFGKANTGWGKITVQP